MVRGRDLVRATIWIVAGGFAVLAASASPGQDCHSGAVSTEQAFLYGRFEVRMQSAAGDGVVSSFFAYNLDLGCNWPDENNEIDVEMTGNRDDSVQFTTHYPGPVGRTQIVPVEFNPHAGLHTYAFEWTPGMVRWFADGEPAYTQDQPFVADLIHPMRILMNLWAADAPSWVGPWTGAPLPVASHYEYVSYARYTPGAGDTGTGRNFTLEWTDEFNELDPGRWSVSEFGSFGGNFCTFVSSKVSVGGGQLHLEMTAPEDLGPAVPVTFQVNVDALDLAPNDRLYLNGGFNNWNGWSLPLSDRDDDGVWTRTVLLPPGKHEYLFTRNGWSEVGNAPLGSQCDFAPCDEFANYGLVVPIGSAPITVPAVCWKTCDACPAEPIGTCAADLDRDLAATAADLVRLVRDIGCVGSECIGDLDGNGRTGRPDIEAMMAALYLPCEGL